MKDIRRLYQPYYPKILKDNQGFKYNLSEESIFGNLYYSMNSDFLKGKSVNFNSEFGNKNNSYFSNSIQHRPVRLIPISRIKKA